MHPQKVLWLWQEGLGWRESRSREKVACSGSRNGELDTTAPGLGAQKMQGVRRDDAWEGSWVCHRAQGRAGPKRWGEWAGISRV